jgi:hypothetical protein
MDSWERSLRMPYARFRRLRVWTCPVRWIPRLKLLSRNNTGAEGHSVSEEGGPE